MKHDLSLMDISRELERVGCGIVVRRAPPPKKIAPMPANCRSPEVWNAIRAVADRTGVSFEAMRGPCRIHKIVSARMEAMRAVADAVGWVPTIEETARKSTYYRTSTLRKDRRRHFTGARHTTVLNALGTLSNKRSKKGEA